MNPGSDRLRGLRRWEQWLKNRLSPHTVIREEPTKRHEAVWRVRFSDDTEASVHLTDRAVRLDESEFEKLTDVLEPISWVRLVRSARPGGLRLHADGAIEAVYLGGR